MDTPATRHSDHLVLGSGIAGLLTARKLARLGRVTLVTKKEATESNTNYAQGGIAAVMSEFDSFESHVRDTLVAGAGLCDEAVVRLSVSEAPERVRELQELGVRFSERASVVDLGRLNVKSGDKIQFRLDIGRDGCGGITGWWVDNMKVTICKVATKVEAAHVPEPSKAGQASSAKVTVSRDGSTGTAPTGPGTRCGCRRCRPSCSPRRGTTCG